MKHSTLLWHATTQPIMTEENTQRAARLWRYLEQAGRPVLYKEIRADMGLSYQQTVLAVGLLCNAKIARVDVKTVWNGCYYIYPHEVSIETPVPVIRG